MRRGRAWLSFGQVAAAFAKGIGAVLLAMVIRGKRKRQRKTTPAREIVPGSEAHHVAHGAERSTVIADSTEGLSDGASLTVLPDRDSDASPVTSAACRGACQEGDTGGLPVQEQGGASVLYRRYSDDNREYMLAERSDSEARSGDIVIASLLALPAPQYPVESVPESQVSGVKGLWQGAAEQQDVRRRHRPPERRGGRPRREIVEQPRQRLRRPSARRVDERPFLVRCRREERGWVVGLEPLDDDLSFLQDGQPLEPERIVETFLPLRSDSKVVVSDGRGRELSYIPLRGSCYCFRLESPTEGILVEDEELVAGQVYLIIVRGRLETVNDMEEEPIALPGWSAYYFAGAHATEKVTIGARVMPLRLRRPSEPELWIVGHPVDGVDERYHAFFDVSKICWSSLLVDVRTVVIRLERGSRAFSCSWEVSGDETEIPDDIRAELRGIGAGRFAVRCYDGDQRLVVSRDFRLAVGLKKVSRTVLSDGSVRVEFDLDPNFRVEAVDGSVEVSCADPSAFVIRPHQRQSRPEWWDLFEWRVHAPSGNTVLLGVDLGRAVWALGVGERPPAADQWGNELLQLQRSDFAATSANVVWIWVPPSLRGDKVAVCIAQCNRNEQGRTLAGRKVVKDGHFYRLPLREMEHLIPKQTGEYAVILQHANGMLEIGRFELRWQCRFCGFRDREQQRVLHHVAVQHFSECFEQISANELWKCMGKLLPNRVYVCGYCGKGFPEDGAENGNTAVSEHQLYECSRARQGTNAEPVTVKIHILERGKDDERMIKALVGDRWRCRYCALEIDIQEVRNHLRNHTLQLVEFC